MNILANTTGEIQKLPIKYIPTEKKEIGGVIKGTLSAETRASIKAQEMGAKMQVKTMQNYPHLITYVRIGYGSKADYQGFGKYVYDYFKGAFYGGKVPKFPSANTTSKLNALPSHQICNNPVASLEIGTENPKFQFYNSTAFGSNTYWQRFSTLYYPTKIEQVKERINLFFQGDFKRELAEIVTEPDEAKQIEREREYIKDLTDNLLRRIIKGVVMEDADGKENYIDTIESFFLAPQEVLAEQFKYVNEVERQEGAHSKAMKSSVKNRFWAPIAYDQAVKTINEVYSGVNYINRILYQKGLNAYQPDRDYKQILHENIEEASKWLKKTRAISASEDVSEHFTTSGLASSVKDINKTPNQDQNDPTDNNNKIATKSNTKILLIGAAILGAIYFIKKS